MNNSIENLKISKASINGVEIQKDHIYLIDIYESLMQPGITGKIQILDFQAIVELGNVFGGDDLDYVSLAIVIIIVSLVLVIGMIIINSMGNGC